jgi:hypothetical protein
MLRGRDSLSPLAVAVIGICVTLVAATCTAHASHVAAEGGWPPPVELSQSGDATSRGPELDMAQNGDLHVVWMEPRTVTETSPYSYTVYHARSDDMGGNWTYSVPLTPAGNHRYEAAMDVDQFGGVHVVWRERPDFDWLQHGQLLGGSWKETTWITHTDLVTRYVSSPDLVVTPDFLHAVWSETNFSPTGSKLDVFYSSSESGGAWSPATTTVTTTATSLGARVAADTAGNLHLVWEENTSPRLIYYISGTVGTTETVWSPMPITISAGLARNATTPDIAVGADNRVHVVFGVDVAGQQYVQDIYYASFPVTDTGGMSATLIPHSRVRISQFLPTYASPAVALVGSDEVHVAWNGMMGVDYADRIYCIVSPDAGASWSFPVAVSPRDVWPDGFPSLAADEEYVHVVWQEKVSGQDQDIYYARRFPARTRIVFPLASKAN